MIFYIIIMSMLCNVLNGFSPENVEKLKKAGAKNVEDKAVVTERLRKAGRKNRPSTRKQKEVEVEVETDETDNDTSETLSTEDATKELFDAVLDRYTVSDTNPDAILQQNTINWTSSTEEADLKSLEQLISELDSTVKSADKAIKTYINDGDFVSQETTSYRLTKTIDKMLSFFDQRLATYGTQANKKKLKVLVNKLKAKLLDFNKKIQYTP